MNEPQTEVLRFAAWYFQAGAHGLTIFFDNPDDPAIEVLQDHPDVTCIRCTPAFWQGLGLTADTRFTKRQNAALTWLYHQAPADWLLNVDADEFLYVPEGIDTLLQATPPEVEAIRFETAEVLVTEGAGGHYRLPMERDTMRQVYGPAVPLFGPKRKGLMGHANGKSIIRCGIPDLTLRQHWAQSRTGREVTEQFVEARSGRAVLHHVGDNYDIWRAKVDWRAGSRGFTVPMTERIQQVLGQPDAEARLHEIYNELHGCPPDRLERLKQAGAYLHVQTGPDAVARAVFG